LQLLLTDPSLIKEACNYITPKLSPINFPATYFSLS